MSACFQDVSGQSHSLISLKSAYRCLCPAVACPIASISSGASWTTLRFSSIREGVIDFGNTDKPCCTHQPLEDTIEANDTHAELQGDENVGGRKPVLLSDLLHNRVVGDWRQLIKARKGRVGVPQGSVSRDVESDLLVIVRKGVLRQVRVSLILMQGWSNATVGEQVVELASAKVCLGQLPINASRSKLCTYSRFQCFVPTLRPRISPWPCRCPHMR